MGGQDRLASFPAGSLARLAVHSRRSLNECLPAEQPAASALAQAIHSLCGAVFKWPIGQKGVDDESVDGKRG